MSLLHKVLLPSLVLVMGCVFAEPAYSQPTNQDRAAKNTEAQSIGGQEAAIPPEALTAIAAALDRLLIAMNALEERMAQSSSEIASLQTRLAEIEAQKPNAPPGVDASAFAEAFGDLSRNPDVMREQMKLLEAQNTRTTATIEELRRQAAELKQLLEQERSKAGSAESDLSEESDS